MTLTASPSSIQLNGQPYVTSAPDVLALVAELLGKPLRSDGSCASGARLGVAVAVNGVVVPRVQWQGTPVAAGQRIEVVTAKQGG
ncbi:hypothetical protein AAV94_01115 [Lampropedia cohaerens]|uniref:Thiamine biosynthesis protein ThiS n=1 Tax=Lampropedia cohaerens TaxID=1610491 RepID=A0A0U1Q2Q8_9BURK|nr:sulfur carrier protein ThiS [Lampropedia cohaerens]KKW69042.1 hypothetical protein AAV94_01115 [Lampropedia cohaerens]